MQKVNTIVLELECVLCGLVAAADLQLSGGPAGRVQQETNQLVRLQNMYILEYTLIYRPQTTIYTVHDGIYLYILSWNIIYRHKQSYTVIYRDIPQTCIYTFMLSTKA